MQANEKPVGLPAILAEFGGDIEKAIEGWRKTADEHPNHVDPLLNLQILFNAAGREAEAYEASNRQLAIDPRDPRVLFNRGWHVIHRGRLTEGFRLLDHGRAIGTYGNAAPAQDALRWSGEDLRGKTLLLQLEAGLGDEIINFRFHRSFAALGAKVVVACHKSLMKLFDHQAGVAGVVDREFAHAVAFDHFVQGMSAPGMLGLTVPTLPGEKYIDANGALKTNWDEFLSTKTSGSRKPRVALRWAGNPKFEHQQYRKFPAELVLRLTTKANVDFFSLQRDNDVTALPTGVIDLQSELVTWDDTAAAIANMDLVITSCTSIAHLSGAMGIETWVIVPVLPYYIWSLPGDTSPWYPRVRLFRQLRFGTWEDAAGKLRRALDEKFPG
ncbi:MAG: hypothetical protein V4760_07745 [Bdellovibrionota bacterium]